MMKSATERAAQNEGTGKLTEHKGSARYAALPACWLLLATVAFAQETPPSEGPFGTFAPVGRGAGLSFGTFSVPGVTIDSAVSGTPSSISSGRLFGATQSFGYAARTGSIGKYPVFIEWTGTLTIADGDQTIIESAAPSGSLFLTGESAANGTIDLTTSGGPSGAQASGTVSGTGGSIFSSASSPSGTGASISQFAFTPTNDGGVYIALTTDGDAGEAAAFGAVIDQNGFSFLGVGDLSDTRAISTVDES